MKQTMAMAMAMAKAIAKAMAMAKWTNAQKASQSVDDRHGEI